MKKILNVLLLLLFFASSQAQTLIFSENMGSPSGVTAIASNTFQNTSFTYTGSGDARNTEVSSGYSGASGYGNIFLTNNSVSSFQITAISTVGYTGLTLSFGAFKSTTASTMSELLLEYSINGSTYTSLTIPAQASGTGTAVWRLISSISLPAGAEGASNLRLRWRNTSSTPQFRIDDVALKGTITATPTISTTGVLSAVNTTYGSASASPSTFSVSGANMTAGIIVTPPSTNFEVSLSSGSGYANTITVGGAGTIASTAVYIRLKPSATVASSPYSGTIVLSSSGASNVNVATVSSSVTAKGLTITGVSGVNKVYDRLTTATLSGTLAYSGLANSESFSVTGTPSASFATATVGTGKVITVTGYTAPTTNYTVTQPSTSADIAQKALTITGITANNKVVDGGTTATLSGTAALLGVISPDDVTVVGTPVATFASSAIATGIAVTVTGYSIGGADAGNYSITQPAGLTADITAPAPAISSTGTLLAVNTTYGSASALPSSFNVSGVNMTAGILVTPPSTNFEVSTAIGGTYSNTITVGTAGTIASTTVYIRLKSTATVASSPYSGNIVLSSSGASNVNVPTESSSVAKLGLTITGVTASNKVFDTTTVATLNGIAVLNGVLANDTGTVVLNTTSATATFADALIGIDKAVTVSGYALSGIASANYLLTQPIGLTATITSNTSSDIIFNTASSTSDNINLNYKNYQTVTIESVNGVNGSLGVMGFYLRDGGAGDDADNLNTELTAITFNVTNSANIRSARLFVGTSPRGTSVNVNGSSEITFTGLTNIIALDNNRLAINLRVTFNSTVTDNQQMQFTIASVTAKEDGSQFATSNGGGASSSTSNDINRIEVTASILEFVQQPSSLYEIANMNPAPSVIAKDDNGNIDLDFSGTVSITSTGNLTNSPQTAAAINGLATFDTIAHTGSGTGLVLTASSTGITSGNSTTTFTINPLITPTFSQVTPICIGGVLSSLSTISTNGIIGSWSPALSNMETKTYTFIPTSGQNAKNATLTITVIAPPSSPIVSIMQPSCTSTTGSIILSGLPTSETWTLKQNGINIYTGTETAYTVTNLNAGTYLYSVSIGNCESIPISVNIIESTTWTGISGSGGSWNPITPSNTSLVSVIISGTYDTFISGDLYASSLVVNSGAVLNVNGNHVVVENCITNDGTVNITNNGSLTCNQ